MSYQAASSYGDAFADVYDRWYENITDRYATARFVAERVTPGLPVLELGVGTGRLVGPMVEAGLDVIGVDASPAMLRICAAAHPDTPLLCADLATFTLATPVGGAICAFNTLFNLNSAAKQQALFSSLGSALNPGAPFVVEAITGAGLESAPDQSVGLSEVDPSRTVISATVIDRQNQTITGQHLEYQPDNSTIRRNWQLRWSTVQQLDDMAATAGLEVGERYSDWTMNPSTPRSEKHITVYRRTQSR